jgi:capsid protein
MVAFESKTPSREYVDYMKQELQAIAACLDIPYEFLMLIFTEGSFSSQRAALIHSKHVFTEWHDWVIKVFLQPLWNWRIAKAIKNGELPPAPVDENGRSEWWRVDWSLPFFDWVDPDRQAKSDERRYDMGATSLSAITKSQGREVREVLGEKAADIRQAIEQARAINEANADANVTWRDLIHTASAASSQPIQGASE